MYGFFKDKQRFFILLFIIISIVVPTYDSTPVSANQMISDIYSQDQDNNQDDPVQEDKQEETPLTVGQGLTFWDYLKMLFALLFVLALLLFVLKFINKKSRNYQQNSLVRNIGGVHLGAQKSVQLIQIGNAIYVVGVGEDVQLIKEIDNPEEIEKLINDFNERQSFSVTSPYFVELVKKLNTRMKKTDEEVKQTSFGEILNQRLSDIKTNRKNELEKWKEKERDK